MKSTTVRRVVRTCLMMAVIFISFTSAADSAMNISSCGAISEPGEYVLNQSILNSINLTCIRITSSNVIFDGAGYTIDGIDRYSSTYGVHVEDSMGYRAENITVTNLSVTDWSTGIYYNEVFNGNITNITASSTGDGIYLRSSYHNTLRNNNISLSGSGIGLQFSSGNNLTNNIANSTGFGFLLDTSSYNNLTSNIASFGGYGMSLTTSSENILINNSANSNTWGIYIWISYGNILAYNRANSNTFEGIRLFVSPGNIVSDNTMNSNWAGIYLDGSNSNTISRNRVSSNIIGIYLNASEVNSIYNNYFNNTNNAAFFGMISNHLNTTKTNGINIIGGTYIGGNYWANPGRTGFSETCSDMNFDGICDSSYTIASENTDYLPLAALAQINISACGIISSPGYYVLNRSILNSTAAVCINITSSNVFFNGAGYEIDGIDRAGTFGVKVNDFYSGTKLANVTIKNVLATDWDSGIHFFDVENGDITGNNLISNSVGIYQSGSRRSTLKGNNVSNNTNAGIYIVSSRENTLNRNIISSNFNGIYFDSSFDSYLTDNLLSSNLVGISVRSSKDNIFTGNKVILSKYDGIQIFFSCCNIFNSNNVSLNNFGINIGYSSDSNILTDNIALKNTVWDFYSSESLNNTVKTLFIDPTVSFSGMNIAVKSLSAAPPDPVDYQNIGTFIKVDNLSLDSWLFLNVSYYDSDVSGINENTLRMWKHNGSWFEIEGTNNVDAAQNYVYANITSFSVVAPMANKQAPDFEILLAIIAFASVYARRIKSWKRHP